MEYPSDFPDEFKPPVEEAFVEAERDYANLTRREGLKPRDAALHFLVRMWVVYAHQVCEAVRAGRWNGERLRAELDWNPPLWRLQSSRSRPFVYGVASWIFSDRVRGNDRDCDAFRADIKKRITDSRMWLEHLDDRQSAVTAGHEATKRMADQTATEDRKQEPARSIGATLQEWVTKFLEDPEHSFHFIKKQTGLDRKTVQRMRDGKTATERSIKKLKDGLDKAGIDTKNMPTTF